VERLRDELDALHRQGQRVTVVYYMCQHAEVFEADPDWVVAPALGRTFHRAIIARPRVPG